MTDLEKLTGEFAALNVLVMAIAQRDPDKAALLAVFDHFIQSFQLRAAMVPGAPQVPEYVKAMLRMYRAQIAANIAPGEIPPTTGE